MRGGLPSEAKLRALRKLLNQCIYLLDRNLTFGRDSRRLVLRRGGREVRIETAATRSEQFIRCILAELLAALSDRFREIGARGPLVARATGNRGKVSRARAWPKILRTFRLLRQQRRPDGLIAL